ncbi:MAG TPA: adenylate/guanylate cyclase domain-containing protein, partial [bacterium]|nr:adenylate/guanylate cyclase domain-containing protein [bacterium]
MLRSFIPNEVAQKIMTAGGIGERRIVTVLFCDVVGSTGLGERLGPERFKVVMDQVLGRLVTAVSRYEGTVAQVLGDGLLALFGAPLAHEDDPERAVRAALDLKDALTAYARELETAYGVSVRVRVGLNTGPVVLSRVIDVLDVAYNALGDTVTTAARLQSAAAPDAIFASEATARLIAPLFETRSVGPLTLKGKGAPVPAVEIVGRHPLAAKPRGISGVASPLVGRDRELAVLQGSVQAVIEGRGQIVAVIGEAGIGKSRLVAEVQRSNGGVRWLEGRCLSYAGAIPYFPFLDLLREWLGVTPADPEVKVRIELRAALDSLFGEQTQSAYPY